MARVVAIGTYQEAARIRRDPREQGRLRKRELRRRGVEVRLRRTLDSIRTVAEVDRVHVGGEDPQRQAEQASRRIEAFLAEYTGAPLLG